MRLSAKALDARYALVQQNLVYLKAHSGKNIDEIADYIGICGKVLRKRMRDPKQFTLDNLDQLAKLFNITLDKLLNGRACLVIEPEVRGQVGGRI